MPVPSRLCKRRWTRASAAFVGIGLVAAAMALSPVRTAAAAQSGIDVSEFQGSINWSQVAGSSVSFAYIRAGEGTVSNGNFYKDVNFQANWNGAAGAGIKTGAYWYFHPGNDASGQANTFIQQLQSVNFGSGALLPAIDVETTDGQAASTVVSQLHTMVNAVQAAIALPPAIYAAPSWWDSNVSSSGFTSDPLWVANWCGSCTSPSVPANNWGGNGWQAWQYADNGSVPGISGNVDLDRGNPGPPIYTGSLPPTQTTTNSQLVYWRGSDSHLWTAWTSSSGWNGPVDLTQSYFGGQSTLTSAPAAVVSASGGQLVYWQGGNNHLYEAWTAGSSWHPPVDLTQGYLGGGAPLASAPAVVLTPGGDQLIYWQGGNGHLYQAWTNAGTWNGPADLTQNYLGPGAALLASPPAVTLASNGGQLVYWQGANSHLYQAWCCISTGWHPPVDLTQNYLGGNAPLSSAPAATLTAHGDQLIYWQGASGHLYQAWTGSSGWNGPADLTQNYLGPSAGALASAPTATLTPDGSQLVYWQGSGGHLFEAWCCTSSGWHSPVNLSSMLGNAPPLSYSPSAVLSSVTTQIPNPKPTTSPDGLSVSEATEPVTGNVDVAALGPNHSLYFYWQVGGMWHGPLGVGAAGSTYSAPSMIVEPNGHLDVAVQGPNNTIYFYWQVGGAWNGPLAITAANSAYSTPSLAVDTNGHLYLAVQGPTNSLLLWSASGGVWSSAQTVAGNNSTYSAPCITVSAPASLVVGAVAPSHVEAFYTSTNGTWGAPKYSGANEAYSPGTGAALSWMGPSNTLIAYAVQSNTYAVVAPASTTYSAPSLVSGSGSDYAISAEGPSNSLSYSWTTSGSINGPQQVNGAATTFSSPSMTSEANGHHDVSVEGPNNALWFYWEISGTWYGPLQVGGSGSTFASYS